MEPLSSINEPREYYRNNETPIVQNDYHICINLLQNILLPIALEILQGNMVA